MEEKGNFQDKQLLYIRPHVPQVAHVPQVPYTFLVPATPNNSAASYSGDTSAQEKTSSNVQPTATTASKEVQDSAYNSEHEHSPEQAEGAVALPSITAKLAQEQLWKSFCEVGNEMIVTKPGR